MTNILNIEDIINIFHGGAKNLEINKAYIDSLNVFPVPDGDTGTNMNLTMVSAMKEMDAANASDIEEICRAISRGALKGARGNSGVILSQIYKGMAEIMLRQKSVNTRIFASALKHGSNVAYDVVNSPKEGTILTVIRLVGDYAAKIAPRKSDFKQFFEAIIKKGNEVLKETPEMLPILKKAGVVDAGGQGLMVILTGMYNAFIGQEQAPLFSSFDINQPVPQQETFTSPDVHNLEDIKFAYCTEFFIINLKKKTTVSDIDKLRDRLNAIGDSLIVVGDLQLVKVHVHTNNPDRALGCALELGELDKLKIENMLEQSREFKSQLTKAEKKATGLVAICVGDGIRNIFKELNADAILEGGQTMNPSVADIVETVNSVRADTVFILPNNNNIILAAEQAMELTESKLVVIATKSIPEGIAAAIHYNEGGDIAELTRNMQKAAGGVRSGQVTHAVRDTEMDGFELKSGDIIGICGSIVAKGDSLNEVTSAVVEKMTDDSTSAITLYYGEGVTAAEAEALSDILAEKYPYHDVTVYPGGQVHYYYFVAVE